MMEDIKKWLDSSTPDYESGVFLFMRYGKNKRLAAGMMSCVDSPTPYYIEKLEYELRELSGHISIPSPRKIEYVYNPGDTKAPAEAIDRPTAPAYNIPSGAKALHKEHSYLHEQMRAATTDQDRYQIACRIMQYIIPSLDALYKGFDIPTDPELTALAKDQDEPVTGLEISIALTRIRVQISRMRKKIANGEDVQDRLAAYIDKKEYLIKKLKECQEVSHTSEAKS